MRIYMNYYVNTQNYNHEVHADGCSSMPNPENRKYLGNYTNCRDAVREAKRTYPDADGCRICSSECHTK